KRGRRCVLSARVRCVTEAAAAGSQAAPRKLRAMQTRDVAELLLLSVLWGAAYLFMRAAVPAFGPGPLIALRMAIAALVLLPLLTWRGGIGQLSAHPVALLVLA